MAKADQIIHALTASGMAGIENKPGNKNIYDNSKVESHSALTPTEKIPEALSDTEKEVYVCTFPCRKCGYLGNNP